MNEIKEFCTKELMPAPCLITGKLSSRIIIKLAVLLTITLMILITMLITLLIKTTKYMTNIRKAPISIVFSGLMVFLIIFAGCTNLPELPPSIPSNTNEPAPMYIIGPGDNINVFVWGNGDLSTSVPVRPDGRITTPLVEDVQASGKTPTQLAREMEQYLARYVKNPVVTVNVTGFVGRFSEQIRVIGEATEPSAIPFKQNMTLLDVIIEVGGLTEFANGDGATVVRTTEDGTRQQFTVRIASLIRDGDISANINMMPGDILIIPESWF